MLNYKRKSCEWGGGVNEYKRKKEWEEKEWEEKEANKENEKEKGKSKSEVVK